MGAVLVGLLVLRPQEIDGMSDGVVYGSMVGLGFALIENIYYYAEATHYGFSGVATTFVLRGVVSPVCQALFASLIGAGVAYAAMAACAAACGRSGLAGSPRSRCTRCGTPRCAAGGGRLALTYAVLAVVIVILLLRR